MTVIFTVLHFTLSLSLSLSPPPLSLSLSHTHTHTRTHAHEFFSYFDFPILGPPDKERYYLLIKKTLKKQLHKKCNYEHTMNTIL